MNLRVNAAAAPVREQVVERLRSAIVECRFAAGGRLIERELCEALGVSRSSVREALRQLEVEGLVTIIPNVGPVVSQPGPEEAREIYEYRAALEGLAGRWFAERATAAMVRRLARTVQRIRDASAANDVAAVHRAKSQFYDILAQGCGNRQLGAELARLRARVSLLRGEAWSQPGSLTTSADEMALILDAIERRDPDAACRAAIAHIERSAARALGQAREAERRA